MPDRDSLNLSAFISSLAVIQKAAIERNFIDIYKFKQSSLQAHDGFVEFEHEAGGDSFRSPWGHRPPRHPDYGGYRTRAQVR